MADDRERTTSIRATLKLPEHGFDMFAFHVAADICEEHGCTEAAQLLRAAESNEYTLENERDYGWAHNQRSRTHFFGPQRKTVQQLTLCGRELAAPQHWKSWFHHGRVCPHCAAELQRRQTEFPEAWEAHLISMDEARPMLTGKEPTHAAEEG